jgi:hypothetical protein
MGYRDQKVIRDTRDAQAARFIGEMGEQLRQGLQDQRERQEKKNEEQKQLQKQAQAAVSGRYKEAADYKRTGNKSLDDQVIEKIEEAAAKEAEAYMAAFGNEGDREKIAAYQKLQATNSRDLNDLTMFIGTFDKDVDEAANALANGGMPLPGGGDFSFDLYVQNNGEVELKKGDDGRYSIFGSGDFAGKEIPLGKYYDDLQKNGTRYEMIDNDYGLVMDEWSKSIIEAGDPRYKQSQQTGGSTKVSTGKKDGGKGTSTPGVKGNVFVTEGYKNDIINKLRKSNKDGTNINPSVTGAPSMTIQQIYYASMPYNKTVQAFGASGATDLPYQDFLDAGGTVDDIYAAFADQVVDDGTYRRGGITDVVATNIVDPNAGIKNVTLNQ